MDIPSSPPKRFAWWYALSAQQRAQMTLFGVCGIGSLLFGAWYVRSQVLSPFLRPKSELERVRTLIRQGAEDLQSEAELRAKDTDGDGLTDWDELNVYKTSPYLADSDSDGEADAVEIAKGQDPNCPKGGSCEARIDVLPLVSASSATQEFLSGTNATATTQVAGSAAPLNPNDPSLDGATLRSFLISNGYATQEELSGINDQDLVKLYRAASQPPSSPQNETPTP